jgi:hypothetical protein
MNAGLVDQIVKATLYEGYLLYPYRLSSVKNRQRWTFGGVFPRIYSEALSGAEPWLMQTECLIHGSQDATFQATVRFLHLCERTQSGGVEPTVSVQEAMERTIDTPRLRLDELVDQCRRTGFAFAAENETDADGVMVRRQQSIEGAIELSANRVDELFRVTVRIMNLTAMPAPETKLRDEAATFAFASTHTILSTSAGEFVSLLDPPQQWREAAAACRNIGSWPVLVGAEGERDTMLTSPIILYDYPQVAPESPGDLFDATEIDEILTLRILTLTDAEKAEVGSSDERARKLLQRTEAVAREQLMKLHGTMRPVQPLLEGANDD